MPEAGLTARGPYITLPARIGDTAPEPAAPPQAALPRLSAGIGIPAPSLAELYDFLASHPRRSGAAYLAAPNAASPYALGRLDAASRASALNYLNCMRFIAGVPADVVWDDALADTAQAAALLIARNKNVSHTPGRPSDMPEELYRLGYAGAEGSNLASVGLKDPLHLSLYHFLGDSDRANLRALAHRRWLLNPPLGRVAFGLVNGYCAMTVLDKSNAAASSRHDVVMYPGQVTPADFFDPGWAWSVSFAAGYDARAAKVTLVRRGDSLGWQFSAQGGSGEFSISTASYGQPNCVIFRPWNATCKPGDIYDVQIEGVTRGGQAHLVQYTVQFV